MTSDVFRSFLTYLSKYHVRRFLPYNVSWGLLQVYYRPCNPCKWEADIWGWLEVRRSAMLYYKVNQCPHWACQKCGHSGGTRGWLGVKRWQLCLQDTSRSAKCHRRAAVGHWVSLCVWSVVGWLIVYQLGILSLSCSQYSQTICWRGWDDNACLGVRNNSIGACPNFLVWSQPWYCIVSPLLQTQKKALAKWIMMNLNLLGFGWFINQIKFCFITTVYCRLSLTQLLF